MPAAVPAVIQSGRKSWWREPSVRIALALWIGSFVVVLVMAQGSLPFNRPLLAKFPYRAQVLAMVFQTVLPLILIAVVYLLTRRRAVPDMATRSPEKLVAVRETVLLWVYGVLVLGGGQFIGQKLFGEGIGLHLNGSIFGATHVQTPQQVWFWAGYNFVLYALVPYLIFRWRGYSREALNLKSTNLRSDVLVVFVVLVLESAAELTASGIFKLNAHQLATGALLSFTVHLLGTGLPVMIFIYAILLPRYMKITDSATTTVLLGALSYVALHIFEYWTVYDSFRHAVLSLIVVAQTFIGPGLIKSYLTLRTGNAWVHLWAYHAIAPHVTADTPVVVKIFQIR